MKGAASRINTLIEMNMEGVCTMRVKVEGVIPFIESAEAELSDITVFVGPQASGKTIFLECAKLEIDREHIVRRIKSSPFKMNFYKQYFGSDVVLKGEPEIEIHPPVEASEGEVVFYIPSHRAFLFKDEFFKPFTDMPPFYPYVARVFSHHLFNMMMRFEEGENIFKQSRFTEKFPYEAFVDLIKEIFSTGRFRYFPKVGVLNGGTLGFYMQTQHESEKIRIPAWSTGQRESLPLILGLMHSIEDENTKWVFIEEPEMGLHPRGIIAVLRLILIVAALYNRKVIISTHSPTILEVLWGIRYLKDNQGMLSKFVEEIMEFGNENVANDIVKFLQTHEVKIHYFDGGTVKDISALDLYADEPTASWGGILHKSSKIEDLVAEYTLRQKMED